MGSQTSSKNIITLRGSSAIVCEYFGYAANSILHLNGVYPEETFERVRKHELQLLISKKRGVKSYLSRLDKQISEWLEAGRLHEIELLIITKATNEVLQSWNFIIATDGEAAPKGETSDKEIINEIDCEAAEKGEKSDKEIMNEIIDVLRRISATYRVLPLLNEPCIFNVVAHIDMDGSHGTIAFKWKDSEHERSYMESFRAFSTKILKAASSVSFKKRKSDDQMHEVDTMVPKKKSKLDD
ncbi:mitotic spindle checkpoint protein MAD2 isoform X5 [Lactuca sativa]|uniref:mitotic spindle checkpoint protein MAD2 isoform X5 n=1 Tax=Lactuca sativa TaxID=4236 RepID=UPI000CD96738|nr:mitotic spindle checkpoint protein MAD2 isoform X5 [Lactuca sativa]